VRNAAGATYRPHPEKGRSAEGCDEGAERIDKAQRTNPASAEAAEQEATEGLPGLQVRIASLGRLVPVLRKLA